MPNNQLFDQISGNNFFIVRCSAANIESTYLDLIVYFFYSFSVDHCAIKANAK